MKEQVDLYNPPGTVGQFKWMVSFYFEVLHKPHVFMTNDINGEAVLRHKYIKVLLNEYK